MAATKEAVSSPQQARDAYHARKREDDSRNEKDERDDYIKALEAELAIAKAAIKDAGIPEPDMEVWQRTQDTKAEKKGAPCRWRNFRADEETWEYRERLSLWSDSGYGEFIQERVQGIVSNAFGGMRRADGSGTLRADIRLQRLGPLTKEGDQTYTMFPAFSPDNCLEVIIRVRKAETV